MRVSSRVLVLCTLPVLLLVGCRRGGDSQPPVATPSITISRAKAALGSPMEITYKFVVAKDAPRFGQDYTVMVHFVDSDEELMWTDDHRPPVPTTQWKPGQTVEYTRTVFVPVYPYLGDAAIQVGLYSSKDSGRLPLAGQDSGQRAYKVGTLQLLAQTENVFLIYKEGWHPPEVAAENSIVEWQWTKGAATIVFRNPKRDCTFFLHADNPGSAFNETAERRYRAQRAAGRSLYARAEAGAHPANRVERRPAGQRRDGGSCVSRSIRPTCPH